MFYEKLTGVLNNSATPERFRWLIHPGGGRGAFVSGGSDPKSQALFIRMESSCLPTNLATLLLKTTPSLERNPYRIALRWQLSAVFTASPSPVGVGKNSFGGITPRLTPEYLPCAFCGLFLMR